MDRRRRLQWIKMIYIKILCYFNSFIAGSDVCLLLITFANSLVPDKDRQNVLKLMGIIETVLLCTHNICIV